VREPVHVLGAQTGQLQQPGDAIEPDPAIAHAVDQERLADVVENGHPRIQRPEGILEHHLDLRAQGAELPTGERGQIDDTAVGRPEQDLAARGRDRAQDAARRGRLTAARLANEPERLALAHREAHVVDRGHRADDLAIPSAPDRERLAQATDLEQRGRGAHGSTTAS
jgi:hypothetical protein